MFKVIGEILTENIISKHVLLNKSEFLKSNPVCQYKHLKWKYLENPNGESFGINGYHNRELTSKIAYQKKIFHYKNKTLAGANLCDLIIKKKFRNIDVFLQLTNQFFIKKDINRSELSIMVPNEISINLYKKLLASVEDKSIYLEEYARAQIGEEEQHSLELKIMLKDFS